MSLSPCRGALLLRSRLSGDCVARVGFRFVAIVTGNDTDKSYVAAAKGKQGTDHTGIIFRVRATSAPNPTHTELALTAACGAGQRRAALRPRRKHVSHCLCTACAFLIPSQHPSQANDRTASK